MLTSAELAAIRETQEANLPDTATIARATKTSDSAGHSTTSWANVATDVPCRAAMLREPLSILSASRETVLADWIFTAAHDANVLAEDQITVNSRTLIVIGAMVGPWVTIGRWACVERR